MARLVTGVSRGDTTRRHCGGNFEGGRIDSNEGESVS